MAEGKSSWVTVLQTLITSSVIAISGYYIQDAIKQKEINSRFVELSIKILSEKPSEEKVPIRKWAVDIVNKYSEVKLDEKSKSLLIYNAYFVWKLHDDLIMTDDMIMSRPHYIESPPDK